MNKKEFKIVPRNKKGVALCTIDTQEYAKYAFEQTYIAGNIDDKFEFFTFTAPEPPPAPVKQIVVQPIPVPPTPVPTPAPTPPVTTGGIKPPRPVEEPPVTTGGIKPPRPMEGQTGGLKPLR